MEVTQKPVAVKVNVSGADGSHIKEVVFGWSGARPITLLSFDSGALGIRHARQAQAAPGGERKSFRFVSIRRSHPKLVTH